MNRKIRVRSPKSRRSLDRKIKQSGVQGEATVAQALDCLPMDYIIFNNVLLKKGVQKRQHIDSFDGKNKFRVVNEGGINYDVINKSTQIDHVVVSPYGIFVIETKNHKGMIFGDPCGKVWTQVLKGGQLRYTFFNPLIQNSGHVMELSKQLGIPAQFFMGIVVFSSPEVNLLNVANMCHTPLSMYNTIMSIRKPIMSFEESVFIANKLNELNKSSKYNNSKHVLYVKSINNQA